mmetsp:Transcript_16951/g.30680  ORF Transcript_16951/g.30680 Transcript_16951/m.30680 type:complete len:196 (-) Transcript_16951:23-610(-)
MSSSPVFTNYATAADIADFDDNFLLEAKISGWLPAKDVYGRPYFWNMKEGTTAWTMDGSEVDVPGKPKPKSRIPPREKPGIPKRRPKRTQPFQQPQQQAAGAPQRAPSPQPTMPAAGAPQQAIGEPEVVYVRSAPPEQDKELLQAMDTSKNNWWAQEVAKAKWSVLSGPTTTLRSLPLPCAGLSAVRGPPLPDIL